MGNRQSRSEAVEFINDNEDENNAANMNNNILHQVNQDGLLFGPYFKLANNDDLVPFAQLVDNDNTQAGFVDRFLQILLDSDGNPVVPEVIAVNVLDGSINVLADSVIISRAIDSDDYELSVKVICSAKRYQVSLSSASPSSSQLSTSSSVDGNEKNQIRTVKLPISLQLLQEASQLSPAKSIITLTVTCDYSADDKYASIMQKMIIGLDVSAVADNQNQNYTVSILWKKYQHGDNLFILQDIYGFVDTTSSPSGSIEKLDPISSISPTEQQLLPSSSSSSTISISKPAENPAEWKPDESTVSDCVICLSETKSVMALPCRHMCLCRVCGDIIRQQQHGKCPICRQPFYCLLQLSRSKNLETSITMPATV